MGEVKFHVTALVVPEMYRECMQSVMFGLRENGYDVTYAHQQLDSMRINIVFGAHSNWGSWQKLSAQASRIIIYNLEPATPLITRFPQNYIRLLQHVHVWDYSAKNVQDLKARANIHDIHRVPICFAPEMAHIESAPLQDIDVLFYGDMSARRRGVIEQLRTMGLHVVTPDEVGRVIGAARDDLIARAKVVLNIHSLEFIHAFEIARVSYWLANRKAVVTELSDLTDVDVHLRDGMACGKIDELAQLCFDLVADDDKRHELEQKGFDAFGKMSAKDEMRTAVERYLAQADLPRVLGQIELPRVLQIGSGSLSLYYGDGWNYEHLNIDARADFAPDVVLDIAAPIDFEVTLPSWRLGDVQLRRGYFSKIIARNVFQSVRDLRMALSNCLELLEDGGVLEIQTPSNLSHEAWSRVEERRLFTYQSWAQMMEDWWQYGWHTHRFEVVHTQATMLQNTLGAQLLVDNGNNWGEMIIASRGLDSIGVVLRKHALTDDEFRQLPQTRFMD